MMPLPYVPHKQYRCHYSYHTYWLYGIMMVPLRLPCISGTFKPDSTPSLLAHECLWTEIQYCINAEEPLIEHRPTSCHWSKHFMVQMCPEALNSVQFSTVLLYFICVHVLHLTDKFLDKILTNMNCNKCCFFMIKERSKSMPAVGY